MIIPGHPESRREVFENIMGGEDPKSVTSHEGFPQTNSNFTVITSATTGPGMVPANEERRGRNLYKKAVILEQRSRYLKGLGRLGVGTSRIECNQARSRREMEVDSGRRVKDIKAELKKINNYIIS